MNGIIWKWNTTLEIITTLLITNEFWLTIVYNILMNYSFIYEQSKFLHPNNYILINAKMKLGFLYGNYKPYLLNTMSRPSLDRKIQVRLFRTIYFSYVYFLLRRVFHVFLNTISLSIGMPRGFGCSWQGRHWVYIMAYKYAQRVD